MILSQRYDITASRNLRVYASLPFCLLALSIWSGLRVKAKMLNMPAVEPIQIILLSINLFVKDWFVGWPNGSLTQLYTPGIHRADLKNNPFQPYP